MIQVIVRWRRRGSLITGRSQAAADWVQRELGVDPHRCGGVTIDIDPDGACTATVKLYLDDWTLDQLRLEGFVRDLGAA